MLEFIFILSVSGNAWQWMENERQAETIQTIKQVNEDNAIAVDNFKASLTECSDKLTDWDSKEADWEVKREISQQGLNELSGFVDSASWGGCRSPVDLEF